MFLYGTIIEWDNLHLKKLYIKHIFQTEIKMVIEKVKVKVTNCLI